MSMRENEKFHQMNMFDRSIQIHFARLLCIKIENFILWYYFEKQEKKKELTGYYSDFAKK
jgi:hypothetical protein